MYFYTICSSLSPFFDNIQKNISFSKFEEVLNGTMNDEEKAFEILRLLLTKQQDRFKQEVVDGFKKKFQLADLILRDFKEHIEMVIATNQSQPAKYFGLYISMVQSSGYGKSRLLIECGRKKIFMVAYMCLRATDDSSGYPSRTPNIFEFLKNHKNVDEMKRLIVCTYIVALEVRKNKSLSHLEGPDSSFAGFWELVMRKYDSRKSDQLKDLLSEYSKLQTKEDKLLIVFDEARALLDEKDETDVSLFRIIRRAQKELDSKFVVLVFVDTLSKVSNFSPAQAFDNSARQREINLDLLPPYYEIQSYDSNVKQTNLTYVPDEVVKVFSRGRPMWGTLFVHKETKLPEVLIFACQKLACTADIENFKPKSQAKDSHGYAAAMCIRYGIYGVLDHFLASDLIKAHLGTGNHL